MSNAFKYSQLIKQKANNLGFLSCGISKAEFLEKEAPRLEKWLNHHHHGEMHYMANHFDIRLNPQLIVDGAKSVISLLFNYYPEETQKNCNLKIAKYAYGKDYHHVLKKKIFKLLEYIRETIGEVGGRAFVDSAPILERAWAEKSGLGWIGKNTNLISKKTGSFFFLTELIIDLELEYDVPTTNHCGNCTKCIDACPTDAIIAPYEIDSNKCISYLTIEYKNSIPNELSNNMDNWIFGCDICQDVCPWNRFSKPHNEDAFKISPELAQITDKDWEEITEDVFRKVFKNSAVKRTKIEGLKRNIKAAKKTST